MAIYSVSVKAHSRSKGESATGGAAYRLGAAITDEQTGLRYDYSRRADVACAFTVLPENAPEGWDEPARLWNEAERAEKRKNSCVSREVLVALPHEMTDEQREELARGIVGDLVRRYGVGASCGIHRPEEGEKNHHAHILITTRRLTPEGLGEKTRELDDQKQGPREVEAVRAMVAQHTNDALERYGYSARVDHRSLADQRQAALDAGDLDRAVELSRAATKHEGRRPEVRERVAEQNANTRAENEQSQAQARAEFDRLLDAAAKQGRAMPEATDAKPKTRDEVVAEALEVDLQKVKERVSRLDEERKANAKEASRVGEDYRAKSDHLEGLGHKTDRWIDSADRHERDLANARSVRARWEKRRPWLSQIWTPSEVEKADEAAKVAEEKLAKDREKLRALDTARATTAQEVAKLWEQREQVQHRADDLSEQYKQATREREVLQHAIKVLRMPEAEKQRLREQEAEQRKAEEEMQRVYMRMGTTPSPHEVLEQRKQTQQHQPKRDRGRDFGMSM